MATAFRQAVVADIPSLMEIRLGVRENRLDDPTKVTYELVVDHLERRGRGWLCEEDGRAVGFAIADRATWSIWALFLRPEAEGRGIGRALLRLAVDWLFAAGAPQVTLSTGVGTRADGFYAAQGWERGGRNADGEVVFTLRRP